MVVYFGYIVTVQMNLLECVGKYTQPELMWSNTMKREFT